jgi:hypothetical protein
MYFDAGRNLDLGLDIVRLEPPARGSLEPYDLAADPHA